MVNTNNVYSNKISINFGQIQIGIETIMFYGMSIAVCLSNYYSNRCEGKTMDSYAYAKCTNKKAMTEAMKLAEKLLRMAEKGVPTCNDDCCLLLYGVIRDCGYKIQRTVEEEMFHLLQKGNRHHLLH
jgi:hypothetical protein